MFAKIILFDCIVTIGFGAHFTGVGCGTVLLLLVVAVDCGAVLLHVVVVEDWPELLGLPGFEVHGTFVAFDVVTFGVFE